MLSALALRSKAHWGYPSEFIESCRKELFYSSEQFDSHKFSFVVAEIAGTVVGFYALEHIFTTEFELEALFVEPEFIGKGVGRVLMDHAKRTVTDLGGKSLVIQGDPHAARFYKMAGGVLAGERESDSIPGRFLPVFIVLL